MKPALNDKRKHQIKAWLTAKNKGNLCPFIYYENGYSRTPCKVCQRLFPEQVRLIKYKSAGYFTTDVCPCDALSVKEVTRRAKEWIK